MQHIYTKKEIVMEVECPDYIESLSEALSGQMALVLTVGGRNDGQADIEFADAPSYSGTCNTL